MTNEEHKSLIARGLISVLVSAQLGEIRIQSLFFRMPLSVYVEILQFTAIKRMLNRYFYIGLGCLLSFDPIDFSLVGVYKTDPVVDRQVVVVVRRASTSIE